MVCYYSTAELVVKLKQISCDCLPWTYWRGCWNKQFYPLLLVFGSDLAIVYHGLYVKTETWPPNRILCRFSTLDYSLMPLVNLLKDLQPHTRLDKSAVIVCHGRTGEGVGISSSTFCCWCLAQTLQLSTMA